MPPTANAQKLARIIAGRVSQLKPEKIDEVRSTLDQFIGFVTSDTLSRLRQKVAEHEAAPAAGWQDRIADILALCATYLSGEGKEPGNRAKADAVETIKAEAMVEAGRREAEAQYLADAYAYDAAGKAGGIYPATALNMQTDDAIKKGQPGAKALAQGDATSGKPGAGQAGLDLAQESGLTEAEILALRTYTGKDYTYMNPATANDKKWMAGQQFAGEDDPYLATAQGKEDMRQLMEQGSLHAAMAVAALQKMEPKAGTCYRGERMTPTEYADLYGDKTNRKLPRIPRNALTSISTDKNAAQRFANREDNPAKTVSVMMEVNVTDGRQIKDLSIYPREGELLLLPGTVLVAQSVKEDDVVGNPKTIKKVYVVLDQA